MAKGSNAAAGGGLTKSVPSVSGHATTSTTVLPPMTTSDKPVPAGTTKMPKQASGIPPTSTLLAKTVSPTNTATAPNGLGGAKKSSMSSSTLARSTNGSIQLNVPAKHATTAPVIGQGGVKSSQSVVPKTTTSSAPTPVAPPVAPKKTTASVPSVGTPQAKQAAAKPVAGVTSNVSAVVKVIPPVVNAKVASSAPKKQPGLPSASNAVVAAITGKKVAALPKQHHTPPLLKQDAPTTGEMDKRDNHAGQAIKSTLCVQETAIAVDDDNITGNIIDQIQLESSAVTFPDAGCTVENAVDVVEDDEQDQVLSETIPFENPNPKKRSRVDMKVNLVAEDESPQVDPSVGDDTRSVKPAAKRRAVVDTAAIVGGVEPTPVAEPVPKVKPKRKPTMIPDLDEHGIQRLDEHGQPKMKIKPRPKPMIPDVDEFGVQKRDADGNLMFKPKPRPKPMMPVLDDNGEQVYDDEGNPLMKPKPRAKPKIPVLDENGEQVYDENGEPLMKTKPRPKTMVPDLDADGNPQYDSEGNMLKKPKKRLPPMIVKVDADGKPVLDEHGNQVMVRKPSKPRSSKSRVARKPHPIDGDVDDNTVIMQSSMGNGDELGSNTTKSKPPRKRPMIPVMDENGEPLLDEEGNPVMKPKPRPKPMIPDLDADGNQQYDADGNVLMKVKPRPRPKVHAKDEEGNLLYDAETGKPVMIPRPARVPKPPPMIELVDDEGNVLYDEMGDVMMVPKPVPMIQATDEEGNLLYDAETGDAIMIPRPKRPRAPRKRKTPDMAEDVVMENGGGQEACERVHDNDMVDHQLHDVTLPVSVGGRAMKRKQPRTKKVVHFEDPIFTDDTQVVNPDDVTILEEVVIGEEVVIESIAVEQEDDNAAANAMEVDHVNDDGVEGGVDDDAKQDDDNDDEVEVGVCNMSSETAEKIADLLARAKKWRNKAISLELVLYHLTERKKCVFRRPSSEEETDEEADGESHDARGNLRDMIVSDDEEAEADAAYVPDDDDDNEDEEDLVVSEDDGEESSVVTKQHDDDDDGGDEMEDEEAAMLQPEELLEDGEEEEQQVSKPEPPPEGTIFIMAKSDPEYYASDINLNHIETGKRVRIKRNVMADIEDEEEEQSNSDQYDEYYYNELSARGKRIASLLLKEAADKRGVIVVGAKGAGEPIPSEE